MSTLLLSAGEGTAAADGEPPAVAGADGRADADGEACGCEPCGASRNTPSPASTTTTTAKSAFCWPAGRSIVPRYFLRRTGRSQKGIGLSGGDEPLSRPPRGAAGPDGPRSAARLPFAWPGAEVSRALLRVGARPPPDELPDGPPGGGSGERGRPAQPPDGSEGRIGPGCQRGRAAPDQGPPADPPEPALVPLRVLAPFPLLEPFPPKKPLPPVEARPAAGRPPKVGAEGRGGAGAGDGAGDGPDELAAGRDGRPPPDRAAADHHDPAERDPVGALPAGGGPAGDGPGVAAAAAAGRPVDAGRPVAGLGAWPTRTVEPGRGGASPLRTLAAAWAPPRAQPDDGWPAGPAFSAARGGRCSGGAARRPSASPGQRRARSAAVGRAPACPA